METDTTQVDLELLSKIEKWERITDEIIQLEAEIDKLKTKRQENKDLFSLFRDPKKLKDKHMLCAVGKHFIKLDKGSSYKEVEKFQSYVQKEVQEKEKNLKKKLDDFLQTQPQEDLIDHRVMALLNKRIEELEDELSD